MRAHELLTEIAADDLLPKTFAAFRAKWLPEAHRQDLYVNFNDHVVGPDTKTFSPTPNHGDPVGLYAYPLEYVLNHPTDIVYGRQARFLRVIQDTSKQKLLLQKLDSQHAVELLTRMGAEDAEKRFKALRGRLIKGGWGVGDAVDGKTFFQMMQYYLHPGQKSRLSNAEQTAALRRAGIDALEDHGTGENSAVIYRDEPEQIVFLSRSAFRVIDSFVLRSEAGGQLSKVNPVENLRRLPVLIAQAMGDRIVNVHSASNTSHEQTSYTAAKRKIVVRFQAQYSWQKAHRGGDTSTREPITIRVLGPDFEPIVQEFAGDVSFASIAADIGQRFKTRSAAAGSMYDRDTEHRSTIAHTMELLRKVAAKLRVPFDIPANPNIAHMIYSLILHIDTLSFPNGKKDFTAKSVIPAVEAGLGKLPRRPVQADQIIAIWNAAISDRRIKPKFSRYLADFAKDLGIEATAPEVAADEAGGFRESKNGVVIGRVGNSLRLRVGSATFEMAQLDNNKLSILKTPPESFAPSIRNCGEFLAEVLNKYAFYCEGYTEMLVAYYDIVFTEGRWAAVGKVGEVVSLPEGLVVVTAPRETNSAVVMLLGSTADGHLPKYEILFWTKGRDITALGQATRRRLQLASFENKNKDKTGSASIADWRPVDGVAFDLTKFIEENGYQYSAALGDDLPLFGLLANKDNDKVGKLVSETLKSIGSYGGIDVFSFRGAASSKYGSWRRFIVKVDGKMVEVARCETDSYNGRTETKVEWINPDLTLEQKIAIKIFLDAKQLGIPVKLRPLLKVDKKTMTKAKGATASVPAG